MILMVFMPGLLSQASLKGFEILDNFSEELTAGDNVVFAEAPFSLQLALCLWVNPSWIRRGEF